MHRSCCRAGWEHRSQNAWSPKFFFVLIRINAVKHIFFCLPGKALCRTRKSGKRLGLASASSPGVCPRAKQAQRGFTPYTQFPWVLPPEPGATAEVSWEWYHNMGPWSAPVGPGTEQWLGFLMKYRSIPTDLKERYNLMSHFLLPILQKTFQVLMLSKDLIISNPMTQWKPGQNKDKCEKQEKYFLLFTEDNFLNKVAL